MQKFVTNILLNAKVIARFSLRGFDLKGFIHRIVKDPISARDSAELQICHSFYMNMNYFNSLLLSRGERILLNYIITRDYGTLVNELPHALYHSLRTGGVMYSIPSVRCLNPPDCKSGDLVVSGETLEFKTKTILTCGLADKIYRQYNKAFDSSRYMGLSIIYKTIYSDYEVNRFKGVLVSTGFQQTNIHMLSVSDLQTIFKSLSIIERVIDLHDMPWHAYVRESYNLVELKLQRVISTSNHHISVNQARTQLITLRRCRENPGIASTLELKQFSRMITQFESRDFNGLVIESSNHCKEPEDVFEDVSSWFRSGE